MKRETSYLLALCLLNVPIVFAGLASGRDEGTYTVLEASIAVDPEGSYASFYAEVTSKVDSYVTVEMYYGVNDMPVKGIWFYVTSCGKPKATTGPRFVEGNIYYAESHSYGYHGIYPPEPPDTYVGLWCVP